MMSSSRDRGVRSSVPRAAAGAALGVVIGAGLLTGCAIFQEDAVDYAIFDREPAPSDVPSPDQVDEEPTFVADSVRLAGRYDADLLYLAEARDPMGGICLLVERAGELSTACSTGSWVGAGFADGPEYHVHPDGSGAPDESYRELTENIAVKDD